MIHKTRLSATLMVLFFAFGPFSPIHGAHSPLVKYRDWNQSPEAVFLATEAELKEWKKLASDAEAEKFIALFWARRDPDGQAPSNGFRSRFEQLVKLADEKFSISTHRGALTERGRMFILVGPPRSYSINEGTRPAAPGLRIGSSTGDPGENPPGTTIGENITTFTYEAKQLPDWAGVKSLVATFSVERTRDNLIGPADVRRLETLSVKTALKNPDLKVVSTGPAVVAAGLGKPSEARPKSVSTAAGEALDAAIAKSPFGALTALPIAYRDGGTRLMMQVYLEGPEPGASLRAAWLVREKDGKEIARSEEEAKGQRVLKGFVVDRSMPLPPGEYDLAFALLDGSSAIVHSARKSISVPPPSPDLSSSRLLLFIGDLPTESSAEVPFVFAGRKFVGRGDGRVMAADGLTYLVRIYGPGVDPATKKAFLKRRIRIQQKGRPAIELPIAPDEPVAIKESTSGAAAVVDVAGTVADRNIGDYFKPGEYTFLVSIEDVVRGAKLELSEPFTIVAAAK